MVTTINELLFPILLFACYYCTVSVAIYHQQSQSNATAEKSAIFPNIQVIFDEEEALSDESSVLNLWIRHLTMNRLTAFQKYDPQI